MDHATPFARVYLLALFAVIVAMVVWAQNGKRFFIRRIPGLSAIEEAVGRAAEMGRPLLASFGLGALTAQEGVITLQALAIVSNITEAAARFGNRVIVPVRIPALMPVAEETIREAYTRGGRPEAFQLDDLIFLSDRQFAFAAGVAGLINREKVASVFLFGTFYAESLIIAENGNRVGAVQVAGTPSTTQIPFFIAACDYVLIGDEFYAATAYLTRQPTLLGAIVGQDIGKAIVLGFILLGVVLTAFGVPLVANLFADQAVPWGEMLRPVAPAGTGG
ncbi:MAG TPA: DUF6754 domain-containing protein [Armatimonadaceae bacterium]|nr:DUF6754 domain-containing protein [Armatimonadaceae bacterium]